MAASHGDGSDLRTLALGFVVDIDGSPLVDAQWAITCNDTVDHPRTARPPAPWPVRLADR